MLFFKLPVKLLSEPGDDVARADICAVTAADALGGIDSGEVVFDNDRVCGALALALHAADAADGADLHDLSALVHIAADRHDLLAFGDELHDALRAGIDAGAAADTLVAVNLGNAVDDVHCVELAGLDAVAEADAGEGAELIALAAEQHCRLAVLGTVVVEALFRNAFRTGAGNECDHLFGSTRGYAHDLSDLCSRLRAASNALVGGRFALGDRGGIAVTAGVAAAAAVCTGKALANLFLLGVYFNIEYLRRESKDRAEDCAEYAENGNGEKNSSHVS